MDRDESTVPDNVVQLARYAKSSGNLHDDDNHDGGQDSNRHADASGTLGGVVPLHTGTVDRRQLWNVTVDRRGRSLEIAVTTIGLRGPLRTPLRLRGSGRNDPIIVAGLHQDCYPATEGPGLDLRGRGPSAPLRLRRPRYPALLCTDFSPSTKRHRWKSGRRLAPYLEQEPALNTGSLWLHFILRLRGTLGPSWRGSSAPLPHLRTTTEGDGAPDARPRQRS